jgi:hypothetical protein
MHQPHSHDAEEHSSCRTGWFLQYFKLNASHFERPTQNERRTVECNYFDFFEKKENTDPIMAAISRQIYKRKFKFFYYSGFI